MTPVKFCLEHPWIYTAGSILGAVIVSIYVKASNIHSVAFLSQWRMYPWCCTVVFHSFMALSYCAYNLVCRGLFGRSPTFSEHTIIGEKLAAFFSFKVILMGTMIIDFLKFHHTLTLQSYYTHAHPFLLHSHFHILTTHRSSSIHSHSHPHSSLFYSPTITHFVGTVVIEPDVFDTGLWILWYVLTSCVKSILHFGVMRLEELADEDDSNNITTITHNNNNYSNNTSTTTSINNHNHNHIVSATSILHDTKIITLLRYSSHLALVTGYVVMSAKFWSAIYYVSGMPIGSTIHARLYIPLILCSPPVHTSLLPSLIRDSLLLSFPSTS